MKLFAIGFFSGCLLSYLLWWTYQYQQYLYKKADPEKFKNKNNV